MMHLKKKHYTTLGSTQDTIKELASEISQNELLLVLADTQTKGHGTKGRNWISSKENLYASYAFTTKKIFANLNALSIFCGIITAKILESLGLNPNIKWPNDLLLDKKKVGGVLIEAITKKDMQVVFIGVGLNVNMGEKELANLPFATSLFLQTQKRWNIADIESLITASLLKNLPSFLETGLGLFHKEFERFSSHTNKIITLMDEKRITGEYVGIGLDGSLILKDDKGFLKSFYTAQFISQKQR